MHFFQREIEKKQAELEALEAKRKGKGKGKKIPKVYVNLSGSSVSFSAALRNFDASVLMIHESLFSVDQHHLFLLHLAFVLPFR